MSFGGPYAIRPRAQGVVDSLGVKKPESGAGARRAIQAWRGGAHHDCRALTASAGFDISQYVFEMLDMGHPIRTIEGDNGDIRQDEPVAASRRRQVVTTRRAARFSEARRHRLKVGDAAKTRPDGTSSRSK